MCTIQPYRTQTELVRAHPEIKNLQVAYQIPRGQTIEHIREVLTKQGKTGTLYMVGNFVWEPVQSLPRTCACLEHVGDNPNCPKHGSGHHA